MESLHAQVAELNAKLSAQNLKPVSVAEFERRLQDPNQAVALRNMSANLAKPISDSPASRARRKSLERFFEAMAAADPPSSTPVAPSAPQQQATPTSATKDPAAAKRALAEWLDQTNRKLAALGFAQLSLEELRLLAKNESADVVREALDRAGSDQSWRDWLAAAVDAVASRRQPRQPPAAVDAATHDESSAPANELREDAPVAEDGFAKRAGFHVFGGSAALDFRDFTTRARKNVPAQCTLLVEGATKLAGAGRDDARKYDWGKGKKVSLMLMPSELWAVLCVAIGALPKARFGNHGEANNKWFEIERQNANLCWTMGEGKSEQRKPIKVPLDAYHSTRLTNLLLRQIRRNDEPPDADAWRSANDIYATARAVYAPMFAAAEEARESRKAA